MVVICGEKWELELDIVIQLIIKEVNWTCRVGWGGVDVDGPRILIRFAWKFLFTIKS